MKKWIEYSLKCRHRQAGFALPVAIGMGLIILLVGMTMLLRSQNSQVNAIAQKDTAKSLNAAETGVSNIRALINQHRAIANYRACATARNANGTCPDSDPAVVSWSLPNNIPNILAECDVNETAEIKAIANRAWRPVDSSDLSQGQYRLLEYEPGMATVQGRVNKDQPSESVSELEVSFPVNPVQDRIAGLWVTDTAETSQVSSGVDVLGPCTASAPIQTSALEMPPIPAQPSGTITITAPFTNLPRPGDTPNPGDSDGPEDDVYQYQIDTLDSSFTIEADKQVEVWVENDIDLKGKDIIHLCETTPNCGPFGVKIFGKSSSGTLSIDDATTICDVFFHAPDYSVESTTGGSTPTGCGDSNRNTGVFWVQQWGSSGSSPVLNLSRASWSDIPKTFFVYPPRLGPVKKWDTKERSVS